MYASSLQVTEGVYHHNVHGAAAAVAAGKADPSDFRFFAQYAGWAPGQLEEECKSGVWFCTAASPALTLNAELSNGRAMWHAVLQVMGGECCCCCFCCSWYKDLLLFIIRSY
jgi:putative transcriptional regulator